MKTQVAIIEDNKTIREGLVQIINLSDELECIVSFSSAENALKADPFSTIDVVLMDIDLPGINGIECTKVLIEKHPTIQIMMLTVYEDDDKIFTSLKAGANGYLLKKTSSEEIVKSIKEITEGGSPMNAQIARRVVASFKPTIITKQVNKNLEELTRRELEVLELLSQGFRYKEIAEKLFVSYDTVRTHVRNIYFKLQVNSRMEAANKLNKN